MIERGSANLKTLIHEVVKIDGEEEKTNLSLLKDQDDYQHEKQNNMLENADTNCESALPDTQSLSSTKTRTTKACVVLKKDRFKLHTIEDREDEDFDKVYTQFKVF